ncbi:hypothetical protein Tco_0914551 [Tanacetum coccineum]
MPVRHKAGRIIKEAGDHDPAIGTNHEYEDSIWNYATAFEKEMNNLSSKKTNIDETVSMGLKSYVNVVTASKLKPKLNFRPLFNEESVENSDFVLPMENVLAVQNKFTNSLVGFFVGKRVVFPLVQNYIGIGESSKGMDENFISNSTTQLGDDSESEVGELSKDLRPQTKGSSTPSQYGLDVYNDPKERRHLWRDLGFHKSVVCGVPWILLGDFNVALNMEDSLTGAYAIFQPYRISNHYPTVLKIPSLVTSMPKLFKFYNFLAHKANFLETILSVWISQVNGYSMFQVVQKMRLLKKPLLKLLHDQGNLHDCVNLLRVELDEVQIAINKDPHNEFLRDEEAVYLTAFNEVKMDEEQFLKQKAKVKLLEVGDSNSAYFHKSIKIRNQRSRIEVIRNAKNVEVSGSCVPDVFVERYEAFLGTQAPCIGLDPSGLFTKKVSDVACDNMLRLITSDEIKHAMFDIGDDKAPGSDG